MDRDDATTIETVFCATDFSETAELAIRHAGSLARRHGARLVLGHVVEPLPVDPYPMPMSLPENEINVRQLAFDRLRERAEEEAKATGLRIDTSIDMGPPGPQIIEMADKEGADLIVLGTRGMTGFKHLVFGSTAEAVVRKSTRPVLTVHPGDREPLDAIREVIVPTDLSPDAEAAAEALLAIYSGENAPRALLAFADSTPPYLEAVAHERLEEWHQPDARREDLDDRLSATVARLQSRGFEVETHILDGGAVEAITDLAEQRKSDLIAMSTHGRSAIVNALLGRTAQRIVQHASCPVLTVRPPSRK